MSEKDLPSIGDFADNNKDLPSISDFLTEDVAEELPSVEEFIEKEKEDLSEESINVSGDFNGTLIVGDSPEKEDQAEGYLVAKILELIAEVRKDIPQIPEIKYYDDELEKLCEIVDQVRSEIPEVRYYEGDIERLEKNIEDVRNQIPTFPRWVNEVNEVPDFSWIGKTFSVIDDDFIKVNDRIETLKERVKLDIDSFIDETEVKFFENKVQIESSIQELDEKYQKAKDNIWKELRESSLKIWEYHKEFKDDDRKLKKQITNEYNSLKQSLEEKIKVFNENSVNTDKVLLNYFETLREEISELPKVKYYDDDLRHVTKDIKDLYSLVETIKLEQKNLQENLLTEPPNEKESIGASPDPLTPMDQNFATLDDLANHYKIFINRIQTQLSTMGGGGAGFIKDLDDVSFDQTTGNGKLLIYNGSQWVGIASTSIGAIGIQSSGTTISDSITRLNFVGVGNTFAVNGTTVDISISSVGAGATWAETSAGIHTTKNVGIGTTARSDYKLYVEGDALFTGNVSVAGTVTYEDVTNVDSVGLITARTGIDVLAGGINVVGVSTISTGVGTVYVGLGSTALYVDGNARVTGILTVGRASVVIDGDNNTITAGDVFITGSSITIGDNVTINTGATGINSAPNVIYVAKDGSDSKNGTSIDNAKLTIAGAIGVATTGTIIKVLAGNYAENNPIEVPAFVSIVGDDLKTVTVTPNTADKDIFHVRKGCYLANMTFTNHVAPAAAVGFPTSEIATNVGGGKWESPYIQNCTSNTTTGTGLRVDGAQAESLKSIVCDSYTQYNQGGVGVAITNQGFAQLVSVFTICCNEAITCYKGSTCDLTNSNSSFGTYGLVSDGVSDEQFTGIVTSTAAAAQDNVVVALSTSIRPYDGQVVYFGELFESVETITVGSGGTGYTSTPTVTIDAPTGPNGETATAFATLDGDSVSEITIISSGSQYRTTPTITISSPDVGSNGATATASMAPIYYTINSSTPVTAGITTLTLDENLINSVGVGTTVHFFQQSKIVASSHTFEYVGSGNDITAATPLRGGVPIQANEVITSNGGKVVYTSTDQSGNFRIGDDLQINQNTGTISGRAFSRSLFSEMTPFILALS